MNVDFNFINHKYFPLFAVAGLFVLLYLYFLSQRNFNFKNGFSNTTNHIQKNMYIYGALLGLAVIYTFGKQYFEFATYDVRDPALLRKVNLSVNRNQSDEHLFRQMNQPYNQDQPQPEVKVLVGMKLKYGDGPESPMTLSTNDSLKSFSLNDRGREFKGTHDILRLIASYGNYIYCYDINSENDLPLNRDIMMNEWDTIPRMDTTGTKEIGEYQLMVQVFLYKSSPTEYSISDPTTVTERVNYTNTNIPTVSTVPETTESSVLLSPVSPDVRVGLTFDDDIIGI